MQRRGRVQISMLPASAPTGLRLRHRKRPHTSQISPESIFGHARRLGIDPDAESDSEDEPFQLDSEEEEEASAETFIDMQSPTKIVVENAPLRGEERFAPALTDAGKGIVEGFAPRDEWCVTVTPPRLKR